MEFREALNISVSLAVLKVGNERFIGDIADIIRMLINEDATPEDLPNLIKSSYYIRNFKYSKDLYAYVHATATTMFRERKIDGELYEIIKRIYTEHDILTDSPFVKPRVQR